MRDYAAAAGALACLAKPVDPRLFLDVMHALSGRPVPEAGIQPVEPAPLRIEAERLDRVRELYVSALPRHLSAIALSAQEGDPAAVAASAQALAEASSEAGHAEVAWLCGTIAADANRGVLAHARLMQLMAISASAYGGRRPLAG